MHTTVGHLGNIFALDGPNLACQTACAASSQAIGEALELIRAGDADVMAAGGAHSMLHPLGISGFNRLTALSQRNDSPRTASRPFDLTRDGFVIGEGAGIVILEELEHAKQRGATILAELTGYGSTADAYRMTDPHPQGKGAVRCMAEALKDAGLKPTDVGYINAHGTATKLNDKIESLAIHQVFGDKAWVSSTKGATGHLLGAAGSVEAVLSALVLKEGVLPDTRNLMHPDPQCRVKHVEKGGMKHQVRHVLSLSYGFGGQLGAVIFSKL